MVAEIPVPDGRKFPVSASEWQWPVGKAAQYVRYAFCATTGEMDFLNRFPCGGDGPDFVSEIYLTPAGKAQLAGTDKQVESQHHRQPHQLSSLLIVANALKQFGQLLRRQGGIVVLTGGAVTPSDAAPGCFR